MAQRRRFEGRVAVASGLVMAIQVIAGGQAAADQSKTLQRTEAGVTFTAAVAGGEAVLVAQDKDVRVEKRTAGDRATIVVSTDRDRVTVTLSAGEVHVARGGRGAKLIASKVSKEEFGAVRAVLQGSTALEAAGRLRTVLDGGVQAPAPVASALAFVSMLGGDVVGMQRIAAARSGQPGIQFARIVPECWNDYSSTVNQYWYDLEACLDINRWNILLWHGCHFEWTVKVELAWFGAIACAGGLPAV